MRRLKNELRNKEIDYEKLLKYGFTKELEKYVYKTTICNDQFEIIVEIINNEMTSKIIDLANDDEYVLVDIENSTGEFVGKVREEYENKLNEIIGACTYSSVFKSNQAKEIIEYISEKYNDELEFLWKKFDDNAIWRNKQNQKWYGALLKVCENKLGKDSDKEVEIIDLRYEKGDVDKIIDGKSIFPGYHMNKQSWITIILDGSVKMDKIKELIDNSYRLSGGTLMQNMLEYLTTIPKGKVVTYKQVAEHLGNKGLARAVGNMLHKNPDGDKYPCYKVLNSKGELAESFVFGGKNVQKERLEKDGIKVENNIVDLKKYQWEEAKRRRK